MIAHSDGNMLPARLLSQSGVESGPAAPRKIHFRPRMRGGAPGEGRRAIEITTAEARSDAQRAAPFHEQSRHIAAGARSAAEGFERTLHALFLPAVVTDLLLHRLVQCRDDRYGIGGVG